MAVPSSHPGTFVSCFVINAAYSPEPLVLWGTGDRERVGGSPDLHRMLLVSAQPALGDPIWNEPELPPPYGAPSLG